MKIEKAELSDGRILEYVVVPDPPAGGMKCTYFAPDRSYVVHFYQNQQLSKDPSRRARLDRILGAYNPTTDPKVGAYWGNLFCWPTGVVLKPRLGIVCPTYRPNFFFQEGPFKGKEKDSTWFVLNRPRRMLSEKDRGTWINYFQICILLARAVRRLDQAGLAHSNLDPRNILIDPSSGQITVIGIDDYLVVPGIFPPDVIGTPGYVAPEVLATCYLPIDDPRRKHASTATDQHALAVLIYEYLLLRHPLRGPKVHSKVSTDLDERLAMGEEALFIENPTDNSNRPSDLKVPFQVLGPFLSNLVQRAFVDGLHRPEQRPHAREWERALCRTWDLKVDCQNPSCPNKCFIFDPENPVCPFCGTRRRGSVPILRLSKQYRQGQWKLEGSELVVHNNLQLFAWHAMDNIFPGESADRSPLAYCVYHQGQWLLVNQALPTLSSAAGNQVPFGQAIALTHGTVFRFSDEPHGRQAEVHMFNCIGTDGVYD